MELKKDKPKQSVIEKPKKNSKIDVMFRENRKFDLHVKRQMITFMGRETKKIPIEWLEHKDFTQVAKYFVIKGV